MLDHITIGVSDIERAKAFYDMALPPLGIDYLYGESGAFAGYGANGKAFFWIDLKEKILTASHIAFTAQTREAVHKFFEAAIQAGGRNNGPPGLRPHYHADYYAAFVLDADGHNIEAVCHKPSS